MHGIKVLMAKNYIDNLSEEARKGMLEKAEQGIWPTKSPLGYRNVTGPDGKKIIAADPARRADRHRSLFEWYATGDISLKEAAQQGARRGPHLPQEPAPRCRSAPFTRSCATGSIRASSNGTASSIQGRHEPLVPASYGSACRACSTAASPRRPSAAQHDFAFSGSDRLRPLRLRGGRARSRRSATSTTIAPATPISARATRPRAAAIRARGSAGSAVHRAARSAEVRRRGSGMGARCAARQPRRRAARARGGDQRAIRPNTSGCRTASTPCMSTSSTVASTPPSSSECRTSGARSRTAACARSSGTSRRPILHGRGRAASRTRAQRPTAVRTAGTARKTPPAQLRAIELHLGGWRSGRHLPPTV